MESMTIRKRGAEPRQIAVGIGIAILGAVVGWAFAKRGWKRFTGSKNTRQQEVVERERSTSRPGGAPQPGDILLFFRPARGRDYIIRFMTRSPFYHSAIFADADAPAGHVIEARPQGVIYNSLEGREQSFVIVPAPEEKGAKALAWARTQIGAGYDRLDPLTILLEHVFERWHVNYVPQGQFTCAEFVATAYAHAGVHLVPGHGLDGIDPGDIARRLVPDAVSDAL